MPFSRVASFARVVAVAVLAVLVALASPAPAVASAPPAPTTWTMPVDGSVDRPFVEPAGPYGAGHRGVDVAAAPGSRVRAAGPGVVTFAGPVAGTLHVVVLHDGGLRTSYSFLADVSVRAGASVARGDVVGTSGGADAGDHAAGVVHFGLRRGDRYLDPMLLFAPPDLATVVRLVPLRPADDAPWSPDAERRALLASGAASEVFGADPAAGGSGCSGGLPLVGDALDSWCRLASSSLAVLGGGVGMVAAGLRALTDATEEVAEQLATVATAYSERLRDVPALVAGALLRTPLGMLVADLVEIGARAWSTITAPCAGDAPPADGTGGSAHRVMVVAGINSAGDAGTEPTNRLDVDALGYRRSDHEVRYFSYAADGGRYVARDTYGDLEVAALRLAMQLQDMQREEPGREVDLIAHSQGGVVVDLFLRWVYDPADRSYPPLGNVVTLSSPHEGAPVATAATALRAAPLGRVLVDDVVADRVPLVPPLASPAVRQLAEHSPLLRDLWDHRLPDHVDFTTIGAAEDPIVPANHISVPGAVETVVAVDALSPHTAILRDADALRAVRAALEHRPMPCVGIATALRSAVSPVLITRVTNLASARVASAVGGVR